MGGASILNMRRFAAVYVKVPLCQISEVSGPFEGCVDGDHVEAIHLACIHHKLSLKQPI